MIFCLGEGEYERQGKGYQQHLQIFNTPVTESEYESTLKKLRESDVKIALTKWIEEKNITAEDKKNYSTYKELGGCLKVFSYEEAWSTWWSEATQKQKNAILDIPQFNAEIFKEITGIDVEKQDSVAMEAIKELEKRGYKIVKA